MLILSVFTDKGILKTGLSPTIKIYDLSDDSLVIDSDACSEVAEGAYKYDFAAYDESKDYFFLVDGGDSLSSVDRYKYSGNITNVLEQMIDSIDSTLGDIKGIGFEKESASLVAIRTRGDDAWKTSIRDTYWSQETVDELFKKVEKITAMLKELIEKELTKIFSQYGELSVNFCEIKAKLDDLEVTKEKIKNLNSELLENGSIRKIASCTSDTSMIENLTSLQAETREGILGLISNFKNLLSRIEQVEKLAEKISADDTVRQSLSDLSEKVSNDILNLSTDFKELSQKTDVIEQVVLKSASDETIEGVLKNGD